MKSPRNLEQTYILYRFYGDGDQLLYIGVTADPGKRMSAHSQNKPWWNLVRNITMQNFPNRMQLMRSEKEAIKAENPRFNIVHSRTKRRRKTTRATVKPMNHPKTDTSEEEYWDWLVWQRWLFVSDPESPYRLGRPGAGEWD